MQNKLIDVYINKNKPENVDLSLINNVNSDNIIETLNQVYSFDWCYEIVDVKEILNQACIIIALYTPGRVFSKMTSIKAVDDNVVNSLLAETLKDMYKNIIIYENNTNKEVVKDIKEEKDSTSSNDVTTLDELEKEVKEINPPKKNPFGIREDQVSFINEFKKSHNIDSDQKFNYYIKTWSDNTGREINTKMELIRSGEIAVDEFIKWISAISLDSTNSSINISSPI